MRPSRRPRDQQIHFAPVLVMGGMPQHLSRCGRILRFAMMALVLFGFGRSAVAAGPKPVRRIAVFVAANDGGDARVELRYAESDAYALAKVLRAVGGLRTDDEIQVYRATPRKIRQAFERATALTKRANERGERTELVFYYSGHSDERGLLLGERSMPYADLRGLLRAVPADVQIAILDSCASGAFTRIKGGKRRPPFLMGTASKVEGYAYLTSSSAEETAQESDRIGGSFFTHFLVSGLRGAADRDGDRKVTLSEAYQFAYDETLEHTQTTSAGAQHAAYDMRLSGSGELVMTDLRKANARLSLDGDLKGRIWVRGKRGNLAAELVAPGDGNAIELALEPGSYTVTVEDDGAAPRQTQLDLAANAERVLARADLRRIPREKTTARGGVVEEDYVRVPVSIGLFPALSLGGQARPIIVNFGAALLWSQTARVQGAAMAMFADVVREDVRGLQWTGVAGVTRGRLAGVQATGGVNVVGEDMRGAQLSLAGNGAGRMFGTQVTLGANVATEVRGAQLGLINIGRGRVRGAQVGLINIGGDVSGTQVGVFNYARSANTSVGFLAGTRDGGIHPEVWTSDVSAINVGIRFAAHYTYSFLAVGMHPAGSGAGWRFGAGFGVRAPIRRQAAIEIDAAGYVGFVDPAFDASLSALATARLKFAWTFAPRLTVFGGPTFNLQHDDPSDEKPRLGYPWVSWRSTDREGDDRIAIWPGFALGLRF